jgi:hypothetical protein
LLIENVAHAQAFALCNVALLHVDIQVGFSLITYNERDILGVDGGYGVAVAVFCQVKNAIAIQLYYIIVVHI